MTALRYDCCDERRRDAVRALPADAPNGIDFIEIVGAEAVAPDVPQHTLRIQFVRDLTPALVAAIGPRQVRIEGGQRIRDIRVSVHPGGVPANPRTVPGAPRVLKVDVGAAGDFSVYTLRLVADDRPATRRPPPGVDPALAAIDFSFKVECEGGDCIAPCACEPPAHTPPAIDYVARDDETFRRLMLDRMAQLLPDWGEARRRHPGDLGVTVVELLAHVADRLSYRQDAIATEAYLATARLRTSVRRHARLVDYHMHDGCAARVWLRVRMIDDPADPDADPAMPATATNAVLPAHVAACTALDGVDAGAATGAVAAVLPPGSPALAEADVVFETLEPPSGGWPLASTHDEMVFHTWGDDRCALRRGATRATLAGHFPDLAPGMILVLAEKRRVVGDRVEPGDAAHRHAVRLTAVDFGQVGAPLVDPVVVARNAALPAAQRTAPEITEIEWADEDALPFDLHVSPAEKDVPAAGGGPAERRQLRTGVAWGNIVPADCGRSVSLDAGEAGLVVPRGTTTRRVNRSDDPCDGFDTVEIASRARLRLGIGPLACVAPFAHAASSFAGETMAVDPASASPAMVLVEQDAVPPRLWQARRDLLGSAAMDLHFVVETEHDGGAFVRFGDDAFGHRPPAGTRFGVRARVLRGGFPGNVAAGSLRHIATDVSAVVGVENPLPARGGVAPESVEHVRMHAPVAFRRQERAVTEADYAACVLGGDARLGMQRAVATVRWTGSWHTFFVATDRRDGRPIDDEFARGIAARLERFRLAGHDVQLDRAREIALDLTLEVCIQPERFPEPVVAEILERLGPRRMRDGRLGHFHPDRLTFGQTIYLSPIIAAVQSVPGVAGVSATAFGRRGSGDQAPLRDGRLELGRLEIARLDNDPSFPERGLVTLVVGGGR